jgi:hypothetical protein
MPRLAVLLVLATLAPRPARAVDVHWTALGGYNYGLGVRGEVMARDLFRTVPLGVSFGIGYTFRDPGNAAQARAIFINDATDGTPEKSGRFWDFKLDGIWFLKVRGLQSFGVFGGLRYDRFDGRFRYVGGNEDFTVSARDWGVGFGARGEVPLSRRFRDRLPGRLRLVPCELALRA